MCCANLSSYKEGGGLLFVSWGEQGCVTTSFGKKQKKATRGAEGLWCFVFCFFSHVGTKKGFVTYRPALWHELRVRELLRAPHEVSILSLYRMVCVSEGWKGFMETASEP